MFGELNLTSLGQRCQWKLHHLRRSNTPPENQNTKSNLQKTMVTKQAKSIYFFWGGRPSFPWWLKDTLSFRKHGPFFEVVGAEVLLWRFGHAKCTFPAAWLKTWRKKAPPPVLGMFGANMTQWYWVFPKIGGNPQNGWFLMENPLKMYIWFGGTTIFDRG